jgi:hypothetical protein
LDFGAMLRVVLQARWCEGAGCVVLVFVARSVRLLAMCAGQDRMMRDDTYMDAC